MSGPLVAALTRSCENVRAQLDADAQTKLSAVVAQLRSPLQVAVAGRIKSGKSTVVNALIGRRIAPTAVGECTRLVTRFHYGPVDRIELVRRDGTRKVVPFTVDGAIPTELGEPLATLSHVDAYLTSDVLRDMTVIDTPGLGSLDRASVGRTEDVLDPASAHAVSTAEAVLYVLTPNMHARDQDVLRSFAAAIGEPVAGPANVIALLNKADTIAAESVHGADGDQWRAATLLANTQRDQLRTRVAALFPVVGLLAEATGTGWFDERDADAFRALATVAGDTVDTMLLAAEIFTSWPCSITQEVRCRLVEKFGLYGIERALRVVRADPSISTGSLRSSLWAVSGLGAVRDAVTSVFAARADGIKAASGLAAMTRLAAALPDPDARHHLDDELQRLLAQPHMHQLHVFEVLTWLGSGALNLPDDLVAEVLRIGSGTQLDACLGLPGASVERLAAHALHRAQWWRAFAARNSTTMHARAAHIVHRAYFLAYRQLCGAGTAGAN